MSEIGSKHTPELKESEPEISVEFFFSAHASAEDFDKLPESLKGADIYIPEMPGWNKEDELEFN